MPGRIPYRDPREQYPPEAAGLPGSPIIIEGAGGFGEGGYEAGNQTAYIPAAGQPIYEQGINPQAASYLSQLSERDAQINQGWMQQQQKAASDKKAYFEKLLGKDFVMAYEAGKAAGFSPQETYDRAWKYKIEQEKFRMQMALQREKAASKDRIDTAKFVRDIVEKDKFGRKTLRTGLQGTIDIARERGIQPESLPNILPSDLPAGQKIITSPEQMAPAQRAATGGILDMASAQRLLEQAGGDAEKARELARQEGWQI